MSIVTTEQFDEYNNDSFSYDERVITADQLEEVWRLSCLLYYYNRVLRLKTDMDVNVRQVVTAFKGRAAQLRSREHAVKYLCYQYVTSVSYAALLDYNAVDGSMRVPAIKRPSEQGFKLDNIYGLRVTSKDGVPRDFSLMFQFDPIANHYNFIITCLQNKKNQVHVSLSKDYRTATDLNDLRTLWAYFESVLYFKIFWPVYNGNSPCFSESSFSSVTI